MDDATDESPTLPSALSGVGGALAGRYQVRARLGRGATKEVYLAYDKRLDREVALAIVVGAANNDVATRARVEREAQVTGRLGDHPNVITVYDSGDVDGVPYLVLRAMPGGSLSDLLARGRPSLAQTIRLGREIALALAHAHAHGVVHRDVKPDNVWLADDGSAALGDFGIAQRAGLDRLTAEGVVVGTVRYLSPEQIRGADVGPASDLYALGVTLYELACGRPPYTADDPTNVLTQHLSADPIPPRQLDPAVTRELERLILALLAKRPEDRPASAAAVAVALGGMETAARDDVPPAPSARTADTGARRLVSVLAAGAGVSDPEALHLVFEACAAVVERHGGTVKPYVGDALVALFGLTESRGDDAIRAVRAATELLETTPGLRLGIESGELFLTAGRYGTTDARGAAVTAAARLAERAEPGEILLGGGIRHTLAADVTVDPVSNRLVESWFDQPALLRPGGTPFVGRSDELAALYAALARSREERSCQLVTVVGTPGIGKSRLTATFLDGLGDDVAVLAGRCRAYGEGTTYRALADVVRGLGDDPHARIGELLAGDEQAIRGIEAAVGLSDEPVQADETAWALRRLLERIAADRPLVVAIEDIHWAQAALLDLLDHVVALSSGAPILLVCLTRPELLDSRPAWAAPQPNRTLLVLNALAEIHARELAELLGAEAMADRIALRAEGNPLFVEQLVAVDAGQDDDELPASIQAVLAARIDGLGPSERMLLQRAAVEGRTFHAGALASVLPDSEQRTLDRHLVGLARRGLIGSDSPEFAGEDAFRFTHALIREAAYAGVPKLLRAELHAGIADWLGERPHAADEIVGYHLEQACRLMGDLGQTPERGLAARAVDRMERASRAALARGDPSAASALLERAIGVFGSGKGSRSALLPALGAALFEAGQMTEATRVLDEAIAEAPEPRLEARAQIEREFVRLETDATAELTQSLHVADAVLPVLEREGDDHGQSRVWSLRAQVAWIAGRLAEADDAWREAADRARRAGHDRDLFGVLGWRATAAVLGPTPVDEAIRRCEEIAEIVAPSAVSVAWTHNALAVVHAMKGEFELADDFLRKANETLDQIGSLTSNVSHHEAFVRMLAGEPERAEAPLRLGLERLEPLTDSGLLATTAAMLAQAVYAQGRIREADELCERTAALVAPDDIVTQSLWRSVRAKVLARDGRAEEAVTLAREAVALIEATDLLSHRGDAMLDLAEVLRTCSRADESRGTVRTALALYESKGNVAAAARARSLLGSSRGEHVHPVEGFTKRGDAAV
jgi:class 3 adenylate cyclase/tetratricopeptide (TPR) repeat protein